MAINLLHFIAVQLLFVCFARMFTIKRITLLEYSADSLGQGFLCLQLLLKLKQKHFLNTYK